MTFVTRFAPSPTGYLHLGHAYSALMAYEADGLRNKLFILRIEDIDFTRCRPEFETAIYGDLTWLGLEWEQPVRRQSDHMPDYEAALERLRADGLLYRCFKTRREITDSIMSAPHGPEEAFRSAPLSPDEEADRLATGDAFAWRLSLQAAREKLGAAYDELAFIEDGQGSIKARPETAGDVVLARKDAGVAYHLAVVVDDALQGVTHVIRGEDLAEAAHIQRLVQALLGLPTPIYRHHGLLVGPDGRRLAKRDKAETLREIRASGVTPYQVRMRLGL